MASSGTLGAAIRQVHRLFDEGRADPLADGELLERFRARGDGPAFEVLVARHGPMVLATARGVLRDPGDAEDAFQATFLILARRAGSIRGGDALGGWLHRVAHRVAVQGNGDAARRRDREQRAGALAALRVPDGPPGDDFGPALHAEVDRLPDPLRRPLVLCDLEGLSRPEAAHRLGWTEGAVRGRLARGRALLRSRLARRGVEPSSLAVLPMATPSVPPAWLEAATRAATVPGGCSASVAALARSLALARLRAGVALAVGLVAAGGLALGLALPVPAAPEPPGPPPAPAAPPARSEVVPPAPPADPDGEVGYAGRVLDPRGRLVAGARVYLDYLRISMTPSITYPPALRSRATSGPDGRFQFAVPKSEFNARAVDPWRNAVVVATAEGFGPGVSDSDEPDFGRDLAVRLAPDDVPVAGRVLDLEGRPIAGVSVRVDNVQAPSGGSLAPWVEAGRGDRETLYELKYRFLKKELRNDPVAGPIAGATTGPDGRFRIDGVGRERVVSLTIEGPTIRTIPAHAMTRRGESIRLHHFFRPNDPYFEVYHAAPADYVASPTRPIEGVVVDKDTGEPVAGASIESYKLADLDVANSRFVRATTDARGRFRLVGMPRGAGNVVYVLPPADRPYFPTVLTIGDPPGLAPVAVEVALKRGVWLRGRIMDKVTGRPLEGSVSYHVAAANPRLAEAPHLGEIQTNGDGSFQTWVGPDGAFRVPALPGKGLVVVGVASQEYPSEDENESGINRGGFVPYTYNLGTARKLVDLPEGGDPPPLDFAITPARRLLGTVLDPEGKPLVGSTINGLFPIPFWYLPGPGAEFTVRALRPPRVTPLADLIRAPNLQAATNRLAPVASRTLVFRHDARQLAGLVDVRGDTPGPIAVKLEPWAVAAGRLVDAEGRPRPRAVLQPRLASRPRNNSYGIEHSPRRILTDDAGRFRVEGLVPGQPYRLFLLAANGISTERSIPVPPARPGATVELGDVR